MAIIHELVEVPRGMLSKYRDCSYADLRAAAERGDDGLRIVSSASFGFSYFRAPDKGGLLDKEQSHSLFCQGWVA